jgi:hypothetical protein
MPTTIVIIGITITSTAGITTAMGTGTGATTAMEVHRISTTVVFTAADISPVGPGELGTIRTVATIIGTRTCVLTSIGMRMIAAITR